MSVYLPKEVEEGLKKARKQSLRRKNRLRVHTGDEVFPVLRFWETGFALDLENAPHLRGFVDIFDGGKHLYQCLVVASEENQDEMIYEFKRSTVAKDKAPLDFARDASAPVALIEG